MTLSRLWALVPMLTLLALPPQAEAARDSDARAAPAPESPSPESLCAMLERRAQEQELPGVFFVRLIWRESAFDPYAVSHKGAQGIAQFMPATAAERGLDNPFDPVAALAASAAFLADLKAEFGNLGLAAAAYNAGPERVRAWLDGRAGLPWETRHFVHFVTGLTAEAWTADEAELPEALRAEADPLDAWCLQLPVRGPSPLPVVVASAQHPPWGVQLAANFSRDRALASFERVRRDHAAILSEHEPVVVPARGRARAPLHAVRIGADTRAAARDLCDRLRSDGAACMVIKN